MRLLMILFFMFLGVGLQAVTFDEAPTAEVLAKQGNTLVVKAKAKGATLHYLVLRAASRIEASAVLDPKTYVAELQGSIIGQGNTKDVLGVELPNVPSDALLKVYVVAELNGARSMLYELPVNSGNGAPSFNVSPSVRFNGLLAHIHGSVTEKSTIYCYVNLLNKAPATMEELVEAAQYSYESDAGEFLMPIKGLFIGADYRAYVVVKDEDGQFNAAVQVLDIKTSEIENATLGFNEGETKTVETSIKSALDWFKRHQSANGQWDVDGYMDNCRDQPKCEPGLMHTAENGNGDCMVTAYALMCFFSAGYDHKTPSRYRDTIRKGLEYLTDIQNDDGSLGRGGSNYAHAIGLKALAVAYGMTLDSSLKKPTADAMNYLASKMYRDKDKWLNGSAWGYGDPDPERVDAQVTLAGVMAAHAVAAAGVDDKKVLQGVFEWVDYVVTLQEERKIDIARFPYAVNLRSNKLLGTTYFPMAGALSYIASGRWHKNSRLTKLMQAIELELPNSYPCDIYRLYHNTLAVFLQGKNERKWMETVKVIMAEAQHGKGTGCFEGSWDYHGTEFEGYLTGRLLSTAYCCLTLSVVHRYEQRLNKDRNKTIGQTEVPTFLPSSKAELAKLPRGAWHLIDITTEEDGGVDAVHRKRMMKQFHAFCWPRSPVLYIGEGEMYFDFKYYSFESLQVVIASPQDFIIKADGLEISINGDEARATYYSSDGAYERRYKIDGTNDWFGGYAEELALYRAEREASVRKFESTHNCKLPNEYVDIYVKYGEGEFYNDAVLTAPWRMIPGNVGKSYIDTLYEIRGDQRLERNLLDFVLLVKSDEKSLLFNVREDKSYILSESAEIQPVSSDNAGLYLVSLDPHAYQKRRSAASWTQYPKVSYKGILVGEAIFENVSHKLGDLEKIHDNVYSQKYLNNQEGLEFTVRDKKVVYLKLRDPSAYVFDNGIELGKSTMHDVEKLFGPIIWDSYEESKLYTNSYPGVRFGVSAIDKQGRMMPLELLKSQPIIQVELMPSQIPTGINDSRSQGH